MLGVWTSAILSPLSTSSLRTPAGPSTSPSGCSSQLRPLPCPATSLWTRPSSCSGEPHPLPAQDQAQIQPRLPQLTSFLLPPHPGRFILDDSAIYLSDKCEADSVDLRKGNSATPVPNLCLSISQPG